MRRFRIATKEHIVAEGVEFDSDTVAIRFKRKDTLEWRESTITRTPVAELINSDELLTWLDGQPDCYTCGGYGKIWAYLPTRLDAESHRYYTDCPCMETK